ncbi:MAG TPA: response regulator [bacterium]|jgi:two-component system cell cycle response regulator CpdR|nr:response regulator [bacterium]
MKCSDFTIMFADDNESIRKIYEKNFLKEGYKVVLVEHGARAMAELKEQKVDLLVTDMEMPGMNTLELFPILKKDYPKLPVVVVTGHYVNLLDDFIAKGFAVKAVVNKPVSVGELKDLVRKILKIDGL